MCLGQLEGDCSRDSRNSHRYSLPGPFDLLLLGVSERLLVVIGGDCAGECGCDNSGWQEVRYGLILLRWNSVACPGYWS